MTDQSRVEAVARAMDQSGCWETYDDLMRAGGYFPSDSLLDRLEKSKQRAQAAIEANDAWLAGQGDSAHKVNPDLFSMIEMIRKRMNPAPASHELVAAILSDWAEFHK